MHVVLALVPQEAFDGHAEVRDHILVPERLLPGADEARVLAGCQRRIEAPAAVSTIGRHH